MSPPPAPWRSAPASRSGSCSTISPTSTISTTTSPRCNSAASGPACRTSTPRLTLDKRLERTVSHRASLYEEVSPVRRAMVPRLSTSPGVSDVVYLADALLLENVKSTFAPELGRLPDNVRNEYLDAMDTATSWEAWDRMRRTSGLQVRAAGRVMARLLAATCNEALSSPGRAPAPIGVLF